MSSTKGWLVSKIIAQVNGRTENRATGKPNFDINMEFFLGLDEFCLEKHYWWRRKVASFATVAGTQSYDISDPNVANAGDAEEIEEAFIVNAQPIPCPRMVNPAFTPRQILGSIYGNPALGNQIPRTGFFLVPGQFQQWEFTTVPQSVFTTAFVYWAVPMITDTGKALGSPVPLVPPFLHWGMVPMLERRVLSYLYGQNDPRYQVADASYEAFKNIASNSKQFSSQEAKHSQMQRPSVHSSGGRGWRGSLHGTN